MQNHLQALLKLVSGAFSPLCHLLPEWTGALRSPCKACLSRMVGSPPAPRSICLPAPCVSCVCPKPVYVSCPYYNYILEYYINE